LGTTYFTLLTTTIAFWSLAYAIEIASVSEADKNSPPAASGRPLNSSRCMAPTKSSV
jgi:hypothetical protein